MSWKKHFRLPQNKNFPATQDTGISSVTAGRNDSSSPLAEVYAGHPNRIQRYYQYSEMNNDSDISSALTVIADFCTQSEEQKDTPFEFMFNWDPNETETKLLNEGLVKWVKINKFKSRIWETVRGVIQNGDMFFIRDPETNEWIWLDHFTVEMVKVDENRDPQEYVLSTLEPNLAAKVAATPADVSSYRTNYGNPILPSQQGKPVSSYQTPQSFKMAGADKDMRHGKRQGQNVQHYAVDAKHVVHLSLSSGMDANWPFGKSVLEPIYKTFRQREMLEDSILIYRIQRAPERRVFKIDVGEMSVQRAEQYIEQIKTKMHQRRQPNKGAGGQSMIDSAYNSLGILDDYYLAQTAGGRGSSIETLPGGELVGEIGDLNYFLSKMARGLQIPVSYLDMGGEQGGNGGAPYNDGKLSAATIQEFRFNKFCLRIQSLLTPSFDKFFKEFMVNKGVDIDPDMFELKMVEPQSFTAYRQIELDSQRVQLWSQVQGIPFVSKRFGAQRYGGWTPDDVIENETMWKEENAERLKKANGGSAAENESEGDLGAVGLNAGPSGFDLPNQPEGDMGDMGDDMGGDVAGAGASSPGGDMGGGDMGGGAAPPPPQ